MAATQMNLKMVRGDSMGFQVTVSDVNGSPVDLTGASARMTVKQDYADADGSAVFTRTIGAGITVPTPSNGQLNVSIVPANTSSLAPYKANLLYDIQVTDSSNNVYTVLYGNFEVLPDVSITTP